MFQRHTSSRPKWAGEVCCLVSRGFRGDLRARQRKAVTCIVLACLLSTGSASASAADGSGRTEGARSINDEGPTYRISADGKVDWYTYNGFRRYHAECHVCHGPDGEGSTFAPSLLGPLKVMTYGQFQDVIIRGSRSIGVTEQRVMRPMGDDPNVVCYLDDLYVYLKARAEGALDRGRPHKHEPKPEAARESEATCTSRN